MDRRDVLISAASCIASSFAFAGPSRSAKLDREFFGGAPVQFPAGVRVPTVDEYLASLESMRGEFPPYRKEVERGNELLKDVPLGLTPYEVAYRFHKWRKREVGSTTEEKADYSYYAREWPVRGNPVIMGFFDATGLRSPAGDTTYWCSAFVCWCIRRTLPNEASGLNSAEKEKLWRYQEGAASASYRDWGEPVADPKRGDLAVFKLSDYRGHIGFVHRVDGDEIWVLGGNQGAQEERNGGEVNIARFLRKGHSLKLHSFRTSPLLHPS